MLEAPGPDPSYRTTDHNDLAWFAEATARDILDEDKPGPYPSARAQAWALVSIAESLRRIELHLGEINSKRARL